MKKKVTKVLSILLVLIVVTVGIRNNGIFDNTKEDETVLAAEECVARDPVYNLSDQSVNRMTSDHFQIIWGNNDEVGIVNKEYVQGNLENLEMIRRFYIDKMGMKDICNSMTNKNLKNYKTNVYIANTGLSKIQSDWAYMSVDKDGFGYLVLHPNAMRVDPPSWVVPHELAHVFTYHQGGAVPYKWYEAMANWFRDEYLGSTYYRYGDKVYGPTSDFFQPFILNDFSYFPHLNNWYDAWPLFLYLNENPDDMDGLGSDLMHKLLENTSTDTTYFDTIAKLSDASMKDILGGMARRLVTMDFKRQESYLTYYKETLSNAENYKKIYTTLESGSDGWLSVPSSRAPQQGGYNIVPLDVELSAKKVIVNFKGTANVTGADWRVSLVAETKNGDTRYSSMWNSGENSLTLHGDEKKVYLVVCATPDKMLDLPVESLDDKGTAYPYMVKVSTSNQSEELVTPEPTVSATPIPSTPTTSIPEVETLKPTTSVTPIPETPAIPEVSVDTSALGTIRQHYKIWVNGDGSIDLSKIKLRYRYIKSDNKKQKMWCDNAAVTWKKAPWYVNYDAKNVNAEFKDGYVDLTFGKKYEIDHSAIVDCQIRLNNIDWSSYINLKSGYVELYYDNVLIETK